MRTLLLAIIAMAFFSGPLIAESETIVIELPISGQMAYRDGNSLYSLDTQDGSRQEIVQTTKTIHSLFYEDEALYYSVARDVFRYDILASRSSLQFTFDDDDAAALYTSLNPLSTNSDELYSLRVLDRFNPSLTDHFSIGVYNISSGGHEDLFSYETDDMTTVLPLPQGRIRFRYQSMRAIQNPVYQYWFMLKLEGSDPDDGATKNSEFYERPLSLLFLWNQATNTFISLDQFLQTNGDTTTLRSQGWNASGDKIAVSSSDGVVSLLSVNPLTAQVELDEQALAKNKLVRHWLGVDDLLIVASTDNTNPNPQVDTILSVVKIIDGTWYEREFLRFKGRDLNYSSAETAWQLTANDSERHELSCLFDQALPTQLAANPSAITTSSLMLMRSPQPDGEVISTLIPQTQVTITGEKACTDAVRWQAVTLDDGTHGWIMEADRSQYYLSQE